jgi:protein-S-isoprenylcysteine O-methyltransferase Ste14
LIVIKTVLFMLMVPGLFMGAMPIWLIQSDPAVFSFGVFSWLAIPFWCAGAWVMIWCAWAFMVSGHGTPSPTDPPKELVVRGFYSFVRNPIYLSVISIFIGYIFWHPSRAILLCLPIAAVSSHLFVICYEEPHLHKIFGDTYVQYCRSVPRWIPRLGKCQWNSKH